MNRLFNLLIVLVLAFLPIVAQTPESIAFDNAYWASFPPEVQALRTMEPLSAAREEKATALAVSGIIIDRNIHALGAVSPFYEMRLREKYGYTWVPSILQPPGVGTDHPWFMMPPGINAPGIQPYPVNPPAGSVKVSSKIADYPAFAKETPPPAVDNTIVGAYNVGNYYFSGPGDSKDIPAGTVVTEARGKFAKKVWYTPFGASVMWEKL